VLAEIVQQRHATAEAALVPEPASAASSPTEAIDPICGMTVTLAKARRTAEHEGRAYYFCCGGCRERFLTSPERYLGAEGAA
jgi:YHS domain-containing protein